MKARQNQLRKNGFWNIEVPNPFDSIDVLIIDNELRELYESNGLIISADELAYMARCFSSVRMIVIMNRLAHNPFDLTMKQSYQGQFESFSDLEIGQKQLDSKVLWSVSDEEFHPSYWESIPSWLVKYEKRVAELRTILAKDYSILEYFQISDYEEMIPSSVLQNICGGNNVTFLDFIRNSQYAFRVKDRTNLMNVSSLQGEQTDFLCRILAARIYKWLNCEILPEMDIFVDAPHLLLRLPCLLGVKDHSLELWNEAINDIFALKNSLFNEIEDLKSVRHDWFRNPSWIWRRVLERDSIPDIREPWNKTDISWVFCEDTSQYFTYNRATMFRADLESPFATRFVRNIKGVDYLPPQRMAL